MFYQVSVLVSVIAVLSTLGGLVGLIWHVSGWWVWTSGSITALCFFGGGLLILASLLLGILVGDEN